MAILKKIKASSLNEVLVASVIIILVFGITMAVLSNLMKNFIINDTHKEELMLQELIYNYRNNNLALPYLSQDENWSIAVHQEKENQTQWIVFTITSEKNKKSITKKIPDHEKN